jgi:hypothetical protein
VVKSPLCCKFDVTVKKNLKITIIHLFLELSNAFFNVKNVTILGETTVFSRNEAAKYPLPPKIFMFQNLKR